MKKWEYKVIDSRYGASANDDNCTTKRLEKILTNWGLDGWEAVAGGPWYTPGPYQTPHAFIVLKREIES